MDLEASDESFLEVQWSHELSILPMQSIRNDKITAANDAHHLAGFIAIAACDNLGHSYVLYSYNDSESSYYQPVLNSENDGAEQ